MNVSLLRRKPPEAPASPERAALAEAIAEAAEFTAKLSALMSAGQGASEAVWAATSAVESASKAIERAAKAAASHQVAVTLGNAGPAPMSIREARAALQEAHDHLAICQATRDALKTELAEHNRYPEFAKAKVRHAALNVLRAERGSEALALAGEVDRLQRELTRKADALKWMVDARMFPVITEPGPENGQPADFDVRATLSRMSAAPQFWRGLTRNEAPIPELMGSAMWDEALAVLVTDANAPLPVE